MSCHTPELFEKHQLSCARAQAELFTAIGDGFKKTDFPASYATAAKGAIGLKRTTVDAGLNGAPNGEKVQPFQSAVLEKAFVEGIVHASGGHEPDVLKTLLRLTGLVNESAKIDGVHTEATDGDLTSVMHGKLAKKSHIKLFQFHAEKWVKIRMNTPDTVTLSVGINATEESALLRLEGDKKPVTDLLLFFNQRPKLSVVVVPPPKARVHPRLAEFKTAIGEFVIPAPRSNLIMRTPNIVQADDKFDSARHHPTLFFLNKVIPSRRYTQRHKAHKGQLPLDTYMGYFTEYARDLANILHAQSILRAVAAALAREIIGYSAPKFTWEELLILVQALAEENVAAFQDETAPPGSDIKKEVTLLSELVTQLYERVNRSTTQQLQRLFTEISGLDRDVLNTSHFGHLLATYAYSNSPIHVVTNEDVRTNDHAAKTKYGEAQKLRIQHISFAPDHGWQDHSQRVAMNVQFGTYRRRFFDLKDIMKPGSDDVYWQSTYELKLEQPTYTNTTNRYALSVKLDAIRILGLRLDVYHPNVHGTELA
jgi:hypothetical protein